MTSDINVGQQSLDSSIEQILEDDEGNLFI
jgi:hypothetical protein